MDFKNAFLIAVVTFIMKTKYMNFDKNIIYDGLSDLHHYVKDEYDKYYKDKDTILSEDIAMNYFVKNFTGIAIHFTNDFISKHILKK
jgi:hypothetical protein